MTESLRAAIYARFSSDKQKDRSIDDQMALCHDYCKRQSLSVTATYEDRAISGASVVNRSGWLGLMGDASHGKFDVVVAEALDRISRDQEDLAAIYKRLHFRKIDIRTVQDGLVGEMHVGFKGLLGALYLKDLAQKTKRGQLGVVRDRRHNGGRSYGYRAVTGQAGELEILSHEAAIIRRIFDDYVRGRSPRDIAAALNSERVPGPRGGCWNASTVAGSRKRQNGILQNALYVGRILWNRQSFIKDPETGRRISRPNPVSEWVSSDVPNLRIIDDETWAKVQNRRAARSGQRHYSTRPRRLLSGLLKCGCCGSGYVVAGADKRGPYLRCSRMIETGLCDNRRTVSVETVESMVLAGIEKHLASPDLLAEYVREFHRAFSELQSTASLRHAELSEQLREVEADIVKIVDLLVEETHSRALRERLRHIAPTLPP